MLVGISNFALVQFVQILGMAAFAAIAFVVVAVRLRLPKTKFDPIIDIAMCVVITIYAITLKINLSI